MITIKMTALLAISTRHSTLVPMSPLVISSFPNTFHYCWLKVMTLVHIILAFTHKSYVPDSQLIFQCKFNQPNSSFYPSHPLWWSQFLNLVCNFYCLLILPLFLIHFSVYQWWVSLSCIYLCSSKFFTKGNTLQLHSTP